MESPIGILAASMSWPELLRELEGRAGDFTPWGASQVGSGAVRSESEADSAITGGELAGKAYLGAASPLLSGGDDPDLITEIAVSSGRLVVGCGVEPATGAYHFVAADGDGLLRCYHHCRSRLSRPFEWGEPIPTEARHPFGDDFTAQAMRAALQYFGFDMDAWQEKGTRQGLSYQSRSLKESVPAKDGPLGRALEGHYDWHQLHPDERPLIQELVSPVPVVRPSRRSIRCTLNSVVFRFISATAACRSEGASPTGRRRDVRERVGVVTS